MLAHETNRQHRKGHPRAGSVVWTPSATFIHSDDTGGVGSMNTGRTNGIRWPWRRKTPPRFKPQPETMRLLEKAAANLQLAAEHVYDRLSEWPEDRGLREEITNCEHEGDVITHEIIRGLLEARLTPYERGGVHALAEAIDDVV